MPYSRRHNHLKASRLASPTIAFTWTVIAPSSSDGSIIVSSPLVGKICRPADPGGIAIGGPADQAPRFFVTAAFSVTRAKQFSVTASAALLGAGSTVG